MSDGCVSTETARDLKHWPPMGQDTNPQCAVTIAANFNCDGITESIRFWFRELGIEGQVLLAPFDQVIQHLLCESASGVCAAAAVRLTVVLIQTERWSPAQGASAGLSRNIDDLIEALRTTTLRSAGGRLLLISCPPSPNLCGDRDLISVENRLRESVRELDGVDYLDGRDLSRMYPVETYENYFDAYLDGLAQIPYTRLCFATLGTAVARKLHALCSRPRKAIVVDCDNTLWSGVCAEIGCMDVLIGSGHLALQRFLVEQQEGGRLICICSKNNEADVLTVFQSHPDMVLRRDHVTAWKVNWGAKADNLRALAEDLDLALDSFIFIDDDTFECAQMRSLCPEVLTLQLPADEQGIERLLRDTWALDQLPATADDRKRAIYYRQNAERAQSRKEARSVEDFIASLELKLEFLPLGQEDVQRAAQLTVRTTQFNLNGIRRSEVELSGYLQLSNRQCEVVTAQDRFGTYGTVGLIISRPLGNSLQVETLLLSCRALGKGVERGIMAHLRRAADVLNATEIRFAFRGTNRNAPIRNFLLEIGVREAMEGFVLDLKEQREQVT